MSFRFLSEKDFKRRCGLSMIRRCGKVHYIMGASYGNEIIINLGAFHWKFAKTLGGEEKLIDLMCRVIQHEYVHYACPRKYKLKRFREGEERAVRLLTGEDKMCKRTKRKV